jgi:hypothetical protein
MSEQLVFTLAAAAVGFSSAVFFCVGAVLSTAAQIEDLASGRWDFHEPVARALTAQRAQYAVGALLLVASFCFQIAAAIASSANPAWLPGWVTTWWCLVGFVLLATLAISVPLMFGIYEVTIRKVLRISKKNIADATKG